MANHFLTLSPLSGDNTLCCLCNENRARRGEIGPTVSYWVRKVNLRKRITPFGGGKSVSISQWWNRGSANLSEVLKDQTGREGAWSGTLKSPSRFHPLCCVSGRSGEQEGPGAFQEQTWPLAWLPETGVSSSQKGLSFYVWLQSGFQVFLARGHSMLQVFAGPHFLLVSVVFVPQVGLEGNTFSDSPLNTEPWAQVEWPDFHIHMKIRYLFVYYIWVYIVSALCYIWIYRICMYSVYMLCMYIQTRYTDIYIYIKLYTCIITLL